MDLSYTEDHLLLQSSVRRYLHDRYPDSVRAQNAAMAGGFSDSTWRDFAELGWLMLPIRGRNGGLGGDPIDIYILLEAFGAALVIEPYIPCALLGARLIESLGDEKQRREALPLAMRGDALFAFAHDEERHLTGSTELTTTAHCEPDGSWRITGTKHMVTGAAAATRVLVSARTADGVRIFSVAKKTWGVATKLYRLIDDTWVGDIVLKDVHVGPHNLLSGGINTHEAILEALDFATAASCASMVGVMQFLLDYTATFVKQRKQFGASISSFQVIQHRLADMWTLLEEARGLTLRAFLETHAASPYRMSAVSAAKIKVGEAARFIAQQSVQLQGAMGTTAEAPIGAYFKNAMVFEVSFGNSAYHLSRHVAILGEQYSKATLALAAGQE